MVALVNITYFLFHIELLKIHIKRTIIQSIFVICNKVGRYISLCGNNGEFINSTKQRIKLTSKN